MQFTSLAPELTDEGRMIGKVIWAASVAFSHGALTDEAGLSRPRRGVAGPQLPSRLRVRAIDAPIVVNPPRRRVFGV